MMEFDRDVASNRRRGPVRTERLILEPQAVGRFEEWLALERARDEPSHRDLTEDQAFQRLCARQGMWDAFGWSFYFVLDTGDNTMVGEVGFQFRRRGLGPRFEGFPEAAWAIDARHRGKGFAAEAMRAVLDIHDRCSPFRRTVALIEARNTPSLRLAGRLGFLHFNSVPYDGAEHSLLARDVASMMQT